MTEEQRAFTVADAIGEPAPEITILDIGAMPSGLERYNSLVTQGCARVFSVEPSEAALADIPLEDRHRFIPHYLGDGNAATFRQARYPGCSSFLEPNGELIDLFETIGASAETGNFAVIAEEKVETVRLDDLANLPAIDLLTIDTQGSELIILENGPNVISKVLVLESEVEMVPIYKDQPLFGHLQVALGEHGFMLHKMIDIVGRPMRPWGGQNPFRPISQMLWADAVFLRDFTALKRFSDLDLIKTATILNDVYLSYDMAFSFLKEHDRRAGTDHAIKYLQKFVETKPSHIYYGNFKEFA
jgi:FkbM family methyltransferase